MANGSLPAKAWLYIGLFLLVVFLIGSKWPKAATALLVVTLLGLMVNRTAEIRYLIEGR